MADLIIKPTTGSGNKLIIQTEDGTPIVTTSDSGAIMHGLGGTEWVEVRTNNFQLEVNKQYMVDGGSLTGIPMNLIMPSSAVMGDRITLLDATRTNSIISWIINPNGLSIQTPGSGTNNWTINTLGIQYELVYFVSTRSSGLTEWIVRTTVT
jgi:hypothetical protein